MKKIKRADRWLIPLLLLAILFFSCQNENKGPAKETIAGLKRGDVILCGPPDKEFGKVNLAVTGAGKMQKEFDLGLALLHSFEYDEAEKVFAKVIDEAPDCAMAYWGVAMSNYHALWAPPTQAELKKGAEAIHIARSIPKKTAKESFYIEAITQFYKEWDKTDHRTRCLRYEKAMEKMYTDFPEDKETAIFYALALDAAADPTDTSYSRQRKAGAILNSLYPGQPEHPGIVHYIIHSYDYPGLAELALPAARKYASIAPASAHAQHMPSHIFTRMGLWDECIAANLVATESARCYAQNTGIKGHWDEELHGLDYLVYAYLQKGDNTKATDECNYVATITEVFPINFKEAYAFSSIPARYVLENKLWKEAASMGIHPADFPWQQFPWQRAITHFTRAMGAAHTGDLTAAKFEIKNLQTIYDTLTNQKDTYKARQVMVQLKTAQAWVFFKEGKNGEALAWMNEAATLEDNMEKHPVTPGEVIPARELLGDLLMEMKEPAKALEAYEADLKRHPNRFNGLSGAATAAERSGSMEKATNYYKKLVIISDPYSTRPELLTAKQFLLKTK